MDIIAGIRKLRPYEVLGACLDLFQKLLYNQLALKLDTT